MELRALKGFKRIKFSTDSGATHCLMFFPELEIAYWCFKREHPRPFRCRYDYIKGYFEMHNEPLADGWTKVDQNGWKQAAKEYKHILTENLNREIERAFLS